MFIMKIWIKFSGLQLIKLFSFLILIALTLGCEDKKQTDTIIVKVGNSTLTKSELDNYLGTYKLNKNHREEFVRRWIERELLFNEALKQGIPNSNDFKLTAEVSNKELAAAFFINNYFEGINVSVNPKSVEEFYNKNLEQFKLNENAVIINYASFADINDAIEFRTQLFNSSWQKIFDVSKNDLKTDSYESAKMFLRSQLPNEKVVRIIDNLLPGEISIVFESEPNIFSVVQLVEFISDDSIPKLTYVQDVVIERYSMMERKRLYNEFVKELYSKYNVEINRDTE